MYSDDGLTESILYHEQESSTNQKIAALQRYDIMFKKSKQKHKTKDKATKATAIGLKGDNDDALDEAVYEDMLGQRLKRLTMAGEIDRERHFAHELKWAAVYIQEIENCLKLYNNDWGAFDQKWSCPVNYVIDLASGAGVFPAAYEAYFRDKKIGNFPLPVYVLASEYNSPGRNNGLEQLKSGFVEMERQTCQNVLGCTREQLILPVRRDAHGNTIYSKTQQVRLEGLSRKDYNGTLGSVQGSDPQCPSRVAILLDHETQAKSFEPKNIVLSPKAGEHVHSYQSALKIVKDWQALVDLGGNAIHIDVTNKIQTNLLLQQKRLTTTFAVVTCTSLLRCCGHGKPSIWENVLETANLLLRVGGYLIQHDTVVHGQGFGDETAMKRVGESMGMDLVSISEPIFHNKHEKMILVVWKKAGNAKEEQQILEYYWK